MSIPCGCCTGSQGSGLLHGPLGGDPPGLSLHAIIATTKGRGSASAWFVRAPQREWIAVPNTVPNAVPNTEFQEELNPIKFIAHCSPTQEEGGQ